MPYRNVPPSKTELMDRCVKKVMAKGKPKKNAIAICYVSIMGAKHVKQKLRGILRKARQERQNARKRRRARFAGIWKEYRAKLSGLSQIPTDYKKTLEGGKTSFMSHGTIPLKKAHHSSWSFDKSAIIEVCFLREGSFRTNGVYYFYPWSVLSRDKNTFVGREFYIGHNEQSGAEYGIIEAVYEKEIDGVKWLVAKIRVPETNFTQALLERIQTGLVKYVSSTHYFTANDNNVVERIIGRAISTVQEGEVAGARILSIQRGVAS